MDYNTLCVELRKICPEFPAPSSKSTLKEVHLTTYQKETILNVVSFFWMNNEEKFSQELCLDIFCGHSGKLYETMVYGWLIEHGISFMPQPLIAAENCLKKSAAQYSADGQFGRQNPVVFDIKQFGFGSTHLKDLELILAETFPNYIVQIGGSLNCSSNEIQKNLLEKKDDIVNAIREQIEKDKNNHIIFSPPNFKDIEIQCVPRSTGISSCFLDLDMTEWAQNSRFYSLSHSSQFCTNVPYIIFYPFDQSLNPHIFNASNKDLAWQFRFLCRRIFMELPRIHDRFIDEFDGKAKKGISVAIASKKISAVVFLDVTQKYEYSTCRAWAYINPNADNPLHVYQVRQWFTLNGAFVDDFKFDNY